MQKIEFTSKEQVIFFMMTTSISLSHYDYKFISNMQSLSHDKKQITSGQAELFDKLLHKYKKQFATNGYAVDEMESLPWKCIVVPSLPKYTNANVDWDDSTNQMIIRVPFKKDFISKFRKDMSTYFPIDSFQDNTQMWHWNSERKRYESNPSTHSLKLAYDILPQFFTTVYHNEIKDIIEQLESKTVEYKDPTLVLVDGQYTVVNSNAILDKLLADITLDNSAECLYRVSLLGIKVDKAITNNDPKLEFAANYITEVDIDAINDCCDWLVELGVSDLLLGRGTPNEKSHSSRDSGSRVGVFKECREAFANHNLNIYKSRDIFEHSEDAYNELQKTVKSLPVLVQFNSIIEPEQCHGDNQNGKIIIITNGRSVNIK